MRRALLVALLAASPMAADVSLDVNGRTLRPADAASVRKLDGAGEYTFAEPRVVWTVRSGGGLISATIRNSGTAPVRLERCRLAETALPLGPESVMLAMSGWQGPSPVRRLRDGKPLASKILAQFWDPASRSALQYGFVSFDRIDTAHEVRWEGRPVLTSYCEFNGFELAPGASVESETLRVESGAEPLAELEHWADAAAGRYKPRIWPKIPAGWVGWSWVDSFNVERYEDVVRRNARAVRERLPGADVEYIWVSIGNLEDRRPGNWLRWNRKNFPSGPEALVRDLARENFKLGLWAGAFWLSSQLTPEVERLRDALLLGGGKPLTVPHRDLGAMYILDPTHPKTQAYLREVFSTWRKWGVRYYMIDFLDAIGGSTPGTYRPDGYYNRALIPGPQAYREGLRVIRETAGPDTYLLTSTGPTFLNIGLIDATRVGTDYGEGRPLDGPGKGFYPGTFVINRPDYWTSHRRATDAMATHFFAHRKLFLADSGNVLTIDKPVPLADAQISATIFAINGGPMMLGDDIARMDAGRLAMVRQLFPRLPECAVPLDLFDAPEPAYPRLFHLPVRREWDEWDLLAIFNYDGSPRDERIDFARLGRDGSARLVWDFWNERYLGSHTGGLTLTVPAQSVRLLRIARDRGHPWLLSTDMHARQGQSEIASCTWDSARRELNIVARRAGNVFVHAPKGLALRDPSGLWISKDANDSSLIVRCHFEPAAGGTRTLSFDPIP